MNFKKAFSTFWILSGSMLEYYDYMVFTYMMPLFVPIIFPFSDVSQSLLSGYGLLFAASVLRPLGALAMGYVGDVFGRKYGLMISIFLISFASLAMGLIPGHRTIGMWGVYIVFVLRILQAMSAGGDLNGAAIFLIEHLGEKPGFASGIAWASTVVGMILASLANYIAIKFPPNGWRYAFIIGATIGFMGMLMRTYIVEGEGYKKKPRENCSPKSIYPYLSVIGMGAGIGGMYYYINVFTYTYLKHFIPNVISFVALTQTLFFVVYAMSIVFSGWISDKCDLNKIMKFFGILLLIGAVPHLFFLKNYYIATQLALVFVFGMFVGPSHNLTFKLFPPKYRYRSISICYGIGTSIIGGATLYVCTLLMHCNQYLPAIWMMLCATLGLLGVVFAEKSPTIEYIDED